MHVYGRVSALFVLLLRGFARCQVGIFNNNHRAGGGLPAMGALQWKDVKQHLERHIFEQVMST